MKRNYLILVALFFCTIGVQAIVPTVEKIRVDQKWLYLQSDLGNVWEAVRPKQKEDVPLWDTVSIPHCFNAYDAVDPKVNYYQGIGWYKTLLDIQNPYTNGRIFLHFEGAGQKTKVYVNTTLVAFHVGGYDEWSVDITDAVTEFLKQPGQERFKGKVPVSIRCDNSRDTEMIPSDLSDFNLYGGLYRYIDLIYTPEAAFEDLAITTTIKPDANVGTLSVCGKMYAPAGLKGNEIAHIVITDPKGKTVFENSRAISTIDAELVHIQVKKPQLWSPSSPNLYQCRVSLSIDGQAVHVQKNFGFRSYEFKEHGGFVLNGEPLLLKGTHRHEDQAGVGAALTDDMTRAEMKMIKSMGANFIRLGHYQQSDLVLSLCDSLGIMVWEEIPWCRGGLGGESYKNQARRMLANMISQHRNHASIIIWGLGNENDWPGDFEEYDKEKIRGFMTELNNLAHNLDPTRLTAIRRCDFCQDIVDVYSPTIWAGWYNGRYTDYKNMMAFYSSRVKRLMHVEWGGDSHALRFSENPYKNIDTVDINMPFISDPKGEKVPATAKINVPAKGDWSESYICDLFDWCLTEQNSMPWIAGAANWTFKDFSTPLRPENPLPYVNQKGLVTRDLKPKESFYVFQSHWADKPMIHVFGHGWPVRWGDEGEVKQVRVYSNCKEVELFLNGKSLGVKNHDRMAFPAGGLHWETPFLNGRNTLRAVAVVGKGKSATTLTDEVAFEYQTEKWGKAAGIEAVVLERNDTFALIQAQIRDAQGVRCLDAANYIEFDYAGEGQMICNLGTPDGSSLLQAYNGRAVIRVELKSGQKGIMAVKSKGLPTAFVKL